MLDIIFHESGEIHLNGWFDATQTDKARAAFESVIDSCVIDMKDLEYMSSAGLGILLVTAQRVDRNGGRITLRNVNPNIRRILAISGMDRIFVIEE